MSVKQRVTRLEERAPNGPQVVASTVIVHGAPGVDGPLVLTRAQWEQYEREYGGEFITLWEVQR